MGRKRHLGWNLEGRSETVAIFLLRRLVWGVRHRRSPSSWLNLVVWAALSSLPLQSPWEPPSASDSRARCVVNSTVEGSGFSYRTPTPLNLEAFWKTHVSSSLSFDSSFMLVHSSLSLISPTSYPSSSSLLEYLPWRLQAPVHRLFSSQNYLVLIMLYITPSGGVFFSNWTLTALRERREHPIWEQTMDKRRGKKKKKDAGDWKWPGWVNQGLLGWPNFQGKKDQARCGNPDFLWHPQHRGAQSQSVSWFGGRTLK